jgi:hypothetical protein
MKSRLTADVAETYPFRNLFDDENQAGIAAKQALDKSRDPVLTHVDDDPSAAIKPRLPRASFAAIGTAVPGATPVVFDFPFRACSGWRDIDWSLAYG